MCCKEMKEESFELGNDNYIVTFVRNFSNDNSLTVNIYYDCYNGIPGFYDHKESKIYVGIKVLESGDAETYNVPVWNINNAFEFMTMNLLHELGHHLNGDTGNTDSDEEKLKKANKWEKLKDEKEGAAWLHAFKIRKEYPNEFHLLCESFKQIYDDYGKLFRNNRYYYEFERNDVPEDEIIERLGSDKFKKFNILS